MKSLIASILILGLVGLVVGVAVKGAETATVTATVTPRLLSVTITTDGSVAYGIMSLNTSKSTLPTGLNDTQTAKNDGNDVENLNIRSSNATGGTQWTLAAAPGENQFVHKFSTNGGTSWTTFANDTTNYSLATNVAVNGTQNFDLQITTPTATTDYVQKTITVTVQAVAP